MKNSGCRESKHGSEASKQTQCEVAQAPVPPEVIVASWDRPAGLSSVRLPVSVPSLRLHPVQAYPEIVEQGPGRALVLYKRALIPDIGVQQRELHLRQLILRLQELENRGPPQ